MESQPSHDMQLVTTYPSGAQEWNCPACGRRFIAQWEPQFRRVVLEAGDERAIHRGSGTLQDLTSDHSTADETPLSDVWKRLLDKLDFDPDSDTDAAP